MWCHNKHGTVQWYNITHSVWCHALAAVLTSGTNVMPLWHDLTSPAHTFINFLFTVKCTYFINIAWNETKNSGLRWSFHQKEGYLPIPINQSHVLGLGPYFWYDIWLVNCSHVVIITIIYVIITIIYITKHHNGIPPCYQDVVYTCSYYTSVSWEFAQIWISQSELS